MVRIRMKSMGRRHRPFYRICVMDARTPRDGRAIEELGHYDPLVSNPEAREVLNAERARYWISVGAQPTEKVAVLLKRHGVEMSGKLPAKGPARKRDRKARTEAKTAAAAARAEARAAKRAAKKAAAEATAEQQPAAES